MSTDRGPLSTAEKPGRGTGLDALARRYAAPLRRYFERRVHDRANVPDLVQDVLLRLARLRDLDSVEKPEHYLFATAASALRDQARRDVAQRRADHIEFDVNAHGGSDFSPDRVIQGRQALAALHGALRQLPERTRDVFVLRVLEEQKTADVAKALAISTRAVESHYAKALAHIAAAIRDHRHD